MDIEGRLRFNHTPFMFGHSVKYITSNVSGCKVIGMVAFSCLLNMTYVAEFVIRKNTICLIVKSAAAVIKSSSNSDQIRSSFLWSG